MHLLTPKEVAARLSVSPRTVYGWIAEGRLDAVHLSERVTRVPEESVDTMVAQARRSTAGTVPAGQLAAEASAAYHATAIETLPASVSEHVRRLLHEYRDQISAIVGQHHGYNVRVFGSMARGDATDASDVDLLIDAGPGMSLFDLSEIESRIESIVDRKVDVVVASSLRSEISVCALAEARPL